MLLKRLLMVAAMLGLCGAAQAADWQTWGPAGTPPMRKAWFADRSSVQMAGGFKRVWIQVINETLDNRVKSMTALVELDCAGRRDRMLAVTMFGVSALIGDKETPSEWSYTAPDSPIETVAKTVCTNDWSDTQNFGATPDIVARSMFDVLDKNGNVKGKR